MADEVVWSAFFDLPNPPKMAFQLMEILRALAAVAAYKRDQWAPLKEGKVAEEVATGCGTEEWPFG